MLLLPRNGNSTPLTAYKDGLTVPVELSDASLDASGVYRAPIAIKNLDRLSVQWQMTGAGGTVAAHRFLITNNNDVGLATLGDVEFWTDVSGSYAFSSLPANAAGSDHYPFTDLSGTFLCLEMTMAAGAVTLLSVLGQARWAEL